MQPNCDDGVAVSIQQWSRELPGGWIKCADSSITKIANQNIVAERAEVGARLGNAPRRIQSATGDEALQEITVHIENINDAVSRAKMGSCLAASCSAYVTNTCCPIAWIPKGA